MESKNNRLRDRVFTGVLWKVTEILLSRGATLLISIVLARILMPKEYGIVLLLTISINIANVFVTSGFGVSLIQKRDPDTVDYSTVFYCSFAMSIVVYISLFFLAPLIAQYYNIPGSEQLLKVFALRIPLSAYNSIQHSYVAKNMVFRKSFISNGIATLISGCVGILMALLGFGGWSLIVQYLLFTLIDTVILHLTIPLRIKRLFSWNSAKELLSFGGKVLVADLIGTVYNQLRSFIVGGVYSPEDLAFYDKGRSFPDVVVSVFDGTLTSVLFPALTTADSIVETKSMMRTSMRITSYTVFPFFFGLIAVAESFVGFALGEKWVNTVPYIQIFSFTCILTILNNINLQALKAIGKSDVLLRLELIKKPVGIAIILLMMRRGPIILAFSTIAYGVFALIVNIYPIKKLLNYGAFEQLKDVASATLLSLAMYGVLQITFLIPLGNGLRMMFQLLVGAVIYIGLSSLTKNPSFLILKGKAIELLKHKR